MYYRFIFLALAAVNFVVITNASSLKRYDGDKVLAVTVPTNEDWDLILNILNKHIPVKDQDVWAEPRHQDRKAFILVQAAYLSGVTADLQKAGFEYVVKISDVQSLIEKSKRAGLEIKRSEDRMRPVPPIIDMRFPRYSEVQQWMQNTTRTYPELATTFSIGQTLEGRPMQILRLGIGGGSNKWRVWIDAGLHAREWLAPTTAIYVAHQLIDGYAQGNPFITEMLEFFDFDFLAVANPDGYEYCHTTERLWRKNRRQINDNCWGVDLNRNFDFEWGGVNADADPCSNLYMGPYPESEVEVRNIVNYIMSENHKYLYYHAYHTWGELFFTRWDYSETNSPQDHEELFDLAALAVNSINNVHNEFYIAGIAPELMYAFAGSSSDWARGVAGIKYPFLTELRDFSGDYGFVAPPEEIEPCGEENWAGMQAVLVEIMQRWAYTRPPLK